MGVRSGRRSPWPGNRAQRGRSSGRRRLSPGVPLPHRSTRPRLGTTPTPGSAERNRLRQRRLSKGQRSHDPRAPAGGIRVGDRTLAGHSQPVEGASTNRQPGGASPAHLSGRWRAGCLPQGGGRRAPSASLRQIDEKCVLDNLLGEALRGALHRFAEQAGVLGAPLDEPSRHARVCNRGRGVRSRRVELCAVRRPDEPRAGVDEEGQRRVDRRGPHQRGRQHADFEDCVRISLGAALF